jgi:hypothetical protein
MKQGLIKEGECFCDVYYISVYKPTYAIAADRYFYERTLTM